LGGIAAGCAGPAAAQTAKPSLSAKPPQRPKLVVLLVVDQMRGDYVDKFRGQWTGGLKRLIEEGAWYRDAAYPYAAPKPALAIPPFPPAHSLRRTGWSPMHGGSRNAKKW